MTFLRSGVGEDVDPRLLEQLRTLGDEFGPMGVAIVAAKLTDPNVLVSKLAKKASAFVVFVREDEEVELRTKPKDGSEPVSGILSPWAVADTAAADSEPLSTTYAREAVDTLRDVAAWLPMNEPRGAAMRTAAANLERYLP